MKKRILSLMMAVALMVTTVPMMANATDTTETVTDEQEETTESEESATDEDQEDVSEDVVEEEVKEEEAEAETEEKKEAETDVKPEQTEDEEEKEDVKVETIGAISGNVVTLGENLNEAQRAMMYEYFGVSPEEVHTIIVTHEDEVEYMEGIATAAQIGATTNSCSFVEPTKSGGIKVKTANLNYVTSDMIASTLATAGMENCNVVAACPFEVSGTGALTGIIMAYEAASGATLEDGKKEAAMEEMILLGELAELVGEETATELINIAKTEILDKGLTDAAEIGAIIDRVAEEYQATLTEEQRTQIIEFLQMISKLDYDLGALKGAIDSINEKVGGIANVWNNIKSFFFGSSDGILSQTNDAVLGEDVITDSTEAVSKYTEDLLTRIMNFFKGENE